MLAHHLQKLFMHTRVIGKLGVKSSSQHMFLAHEYGVSVAASEHFDILAEFEKAGCADEDHLQRSAWQLGVGGFDGAFELASVGVAADGNIEYAQTFLRGIFDLLREKDRSGTGAEGGLGGNEVMQLA